MSRTIDERVVSMQFDNKQFERNVSTSMNTLEKLKQSLNLTNSAKGLENINSAAKGCNLSPLGNAVESVKLRFSALEVMAVTALSNITNSAINAGKRIVSAFTIDPIKSGFQEYETQINAVQTILANTESKGTTLNDVNQALDTLNTYADKTIYNFTEMTRNIGTFTAAGIDLDTSVNAIQGIANLAAVSGSNAQQASTAMYQLSQALASGTVKLMDWNSVVNAGMGGQVFQDALKETARVHGIAIDNMIKKEGSFRETLQNGWLTSEILTETLQKFTLTTEGLTEAEIAKNREMLKSKGYTEAQIDEIFKLGKTATDAATKVKTFTQLMDTLKEAAQSGWTQTWELIIGDFGEAKDLWTKVSDTLGGMIGRSADARNTLLEGALTSNWDKLIKKINDAGIETTTFEEKLKTTLKENGYDVDKLVEKHGSLEEAFRSGAVSSDILKKAVDGLGKSVADLSGVEAGLKKGSKGDDVKKIQQALKDLGYDLGKWDVDGIIGGKTEEAIKKFQELNGLEVTGIVDEATLKALDEATSKTKGLKDSLNSLIDNITKKGGRDLLIDSFKNLWLNIKRISKAIGSAWREIFPKTTSDQLYSFIEGFHNFTEKLKLNSKTIFNIKKTFSGLFSVIDIGWTIIKKLVGGIASLLGKFTGLGGGILSVTGSIGDWIIGLRDSIKETDFFGKAINTVVGFIGSIIDGIRIFGSSIRDVFKSDDSGISNFTKIFKGIAEVVASVGKAIGSLFTGGSIESVFKTLQSGLVGGILYKLYKFVSGFKDSFEDFGSIGSGIKEVLGGVSDALGAFTSSIKAKALKEIAIAVAILAAALWILSGIEEEKLSNALVAMAGAFTELLAAFAIFNKIGVTGKGTAKALGLMIGMSVAILILSSAMKKLSSLSWEGIGKGLAGVAGLMAELLLFLRFAKFDGKMKKTAVGIVILSAAILILSKAVKNFAGLSWEEIGKGLASIGGLLLEIGLFTKLTGNAKKMISTGMSLVLLGAAMKIFASAMKDIGALSWEEIGKGLTGIAGCLVAVGIAMKLMPKGMVGKAVGLIGVGAALLIIGKAMEPISNMSWEEIGKGLVGLAGSLSAIAIAMRLMPKHMITKAIGLIGVAAALMILNKSLSSMSKMSWEEIGKGLVTLGGSMLILSIGLRLMKGTLAGSAALLVAASALAVIAPVLKLLGTMNIKQIGIALLSLAGVFVIFGVAAAVLSPLIPAMFGISAALLVFGVACGLAGAGILAAAIGISALGGSLVAVGASIIDVIVDIAKGLGEIIVSACQSIIESAPAIADALIALIESGCVALKECLPIIGETLVDLANTLVEYAPQLVDSLFTLLITVFDKLAERAPELVSSLVNVFRAIFDALESELGKNGVKNFGKALDSISGIFLKLSAAAFIMSKISIVGALKSVANLAILVAGIGLIITALGALTKIPGFDEFITNGSRILGKIGTAIGEFFGNIVGGLMSGVTSGLPQLANNLSDFMTNLQPFIDGAKSLDASVLDSVMTLTKVILALTGASLLDAIASFVSFGRSSLANFASQIGLFGEGLSAFSEAVSGDNFDSDSVMNASKAAEGLVALNDALSKTTASNSFWGWLSGATDLGNFGPKLAVFGKGLASFSDSVSNGNFNAEQIKAAAKSAEGLVELSNSLSGSTASDSFWGWLTGATDLGNFGSKLKTFGEGLSSFSESVSGKEFNSENVIAAAASAEGLVKLNSSLSGSTASDSFWGWLSGATDLGNFGPKLATFGQGLASFASSVSGSEFNSENVITAASSAEALVKLNNSLSGSTASDSFWGWLTGATDIGNFGTKLAVFGSGLASFASSVSGSEFDADKVTTAASSAKALVKLNESLSGSTASDSFWGWLSGAMDLGNFGPKLAIFGKGLASFASSVSGSEFDTEKVISAAISAKALVKLNESLSGSTASDSFWGWLSGAMDLGNFGAKLSVFGKGLASFASSVSGSEFDTEKVIAAASSAEGLVELNESLKTSVASDSFWGWLTGAEDVGSFGSKLGTFGEGLGAFSEAVSGKEFDPDKIKAAAGAAEGLAALNSSLAGTTASDSFWGWLSGATDIGNFGDKLGTFGDGLGAFSEAVSGKDFNIDKVNAAAAVTKSLGTLVSGIPDLGSIDKIEMFGNNITLLASDLKTVSGDASEIETSSMDSMISNIESLISVFSKLSTTEFSKAEDFTNALKTLGETSIDDIVSSLSNSDKLISVGESIVSNLAVGITDNAGNITSAFSDALATAAAGIADSVDSFSGAGGNLISSFASGMSKNGRAVLTAISTIVKSALFAVKFYKNEFTTAGFNLGIGFANGIKNSEFMAKLRAKALAKAALNAAKAALNEHSPSKEAYKVGAFFGQGFTNGIDAYTKNAVNSGREIAESAKTGLSNAISKVGALVENGIDSQPTIRPVLDLSDVESGAGAINGMLGMTPSIKTLSNVGTISSMMNRSQNGANSDVISAIENLGKRIGNISGDTYQINGVTYDDGSNVTDAVRTIVRAARIERRR